MENAFGQPQTILVLGGTSDIGLAIARALLTPVARTVVLACRDVDKGQQAAQALRTDGVTVDVIAFDAKDTAAHEALVAKVAADHGDIDVAILAFALLGDGAVTRVDPVAAAEVAHVNFTAAVSASVAVANRLREQGHGTLVALSSVAGVRVRKANPVYGGTKAGLDGFLQGLGDSLEGSGAHVLIVRPGFVHSQMTHGLAAAPFATTPDKVAEITVKALRHGRRVAWAPGILKFVFTMLRHVPGPIWRRLPIN